MNKIINFIKKILEIKERVHYAIVSKKDNTGRYRYILYVNGKLCKEEVTVEFWVRKKKEE